MNAFDYCKSLAANLPCRVIEGERGPYLSRYTMRDLPDGGAIYLQHFHQSDEDRKLHNHPWHGRSYILAGGYREERRMLCSCGGRSDCRGKGSYIDRRSYLPGDTNILAPDTFHRVDLLDPANGCWTLFTTGAKVQTWHFWDRDTGILTPWREALARRGLTPTLPIDADGKLLPSTPRTG